MTRRPDLGRQNPACTARRHGDYAAYRNGCRCPHAREDQRIYNKRLREGRSAPRYIPAVGTRRRLRALAVLGWRWQDIGDRLGVTWQAVQIIALERRNRVHVDTARKVAVLYRELAEREGPSAETRKRALMKGWASPMQWDDIDDPAAVPDDGGVEMPQVADPVAVAEFLSGRIPPSALAEVDRVEVYRRLRAEGRTEWKVGQVLQLTSAKLRTLAAAVR